jgi:hypothetical protein
VTATTLPALEELQRLPQWVIWFSEERNGKATKVPYQAEHPSRPASSTEPETWAPYDVAVETAERIRADGIGYVFAADDPYVGIDLDGCLSNGTLGFAEAANGVKAIIDELGSYTELSPSGRGVHIIVRGRITGDRKRTSKTPWGGDFETYDRGRFFTVTGEHLPGTPTTIEARQEQLDAVRAQLLPASEKRLELVPPAPASTPDDDRLLELAREAKRGDDFDRLFRGDTTGHNEDDSAADLALCNHLAFWTAGDRGRIDRLFRRSGLMREKWEERRGDTTYGEMTIDKALEGRSEFFGQKVGSTSMPPKPDTPAPTSVSDDNPTRPYAEEISELLGIIDDPIVAGWRSGRQATCRVVFTTASGRELDLPNWKTATNSPKALAQEIGVQLGVEVTLTGKHIVRLNVLMGKFCELYEALSIRDRAFELGETFLQEADTVNVDLGDQVSRWNAFAALKNRHPAAKARAEGVGFASACIVLEDVMGKRYVRVSWFVEYVKTLALGGTANAIVEHIESPGNWSRISNIQGRLKATDPDTGDCIWQVLYEVPPRWRAEIDDDPEEATG